MRTPLLIDNIKDREDYEYCLEHGVDGQSTYSPIAWCFKEVGAYRPKVVKKFSLNVGMELEDITERFGHLYKGTEKGVYDIETGEPLILRDSKLWKKEEDGYFVLVENPPLNVRDVEYPLYDSNFNPVITEYMLEHKRIYNSTTERKVSKDILKEWVLSEHIANNPWYRDQNRFERCARPLFDQDKIFELSKKKENFEIILGKDPWVYAYTDFIEWFLSEIQSTIPDISRVTSQLVEEYQWNRIDVKVVGSTMTIAVLEDERVIEWMNYYEPFRR